MINIVKKSIIEFYKNNSKDTAMSFDDVSKATNLPEDDIDKALRQLINERFICNPLWADDVASIFYLK